MERRRFLKKIMGTAGTVIAVAIGEQKALSGISSAGNNTSVRTIKPSETQMLRVWKLGSLEHKILPTTEAVEKLSSLLSDWDGKTTLDIIWGPDLQVDQYDLGNGTDIVLPASGSGKEG